jgi:O-methyltransferase
MATLEDAYLELVKSGVTGALDTESPAVFSHTKENAIDNINRSQSDMIRTLVGEKRLNNIRHCVSSVVKEGVEGDFLEAGCWRGGAVLFMKACLKVETFKHPAAAARRVFGADLFKDSKKMSPAQALVAKMVGYMSFLLPWVVLNWVVNKMIPIFPGERYDDATIMHYMKLARGVSWTGPKMVFNTGVDDVKEAFRRYGLLDDKVHLLRGWFSDTLPAAPVTKLAVLRADGDFYRSTMDIFNNMYHKLSVGGYCIVDDYNAHPECRRAVDEFRTTHGIHEPMMEVDSEAVFWKKQAPCQNCA